MSQFVLVVDTESSGLPKNWKAPYDQMDNWPFVVQLSWFVFQWNGTLVKKEDHYIANSDYVIEPSARAIHHISDEILVEKGEERQSVLDIYSADLLQYKPIIVGHFVELDFHLINVEYNRIGKKDNPLLGLPLFCTMQASARLPQMNVNRQLRLVDLYRYFFSEEQPFPHNALYDAEAAARCFFQMRDIIPLTREDVIKQKPVRLESQFQRNTRMLGVAIVVAILLVFTLIVYGMLH